MNIYICATYPTFIKPIADRWQQEGHNVVIEKQFNAFHAQTADVLFAEWADRNALAIQNFDKPNVKKILRIHRYEAYTDVVKYLNINEWDEIVFVNRYIKEVMEKRMQLPIMAKVIPNGIPVEDYEFSPAPNSNKIAYMGYLTRKKGIGELELIANTFRNYEFHFAGAYKMPDVRYKFDKNPNIHFHGWLDGPEAKNDFFKDKKYTINASLNESHGIAICEGMLCGCKPIIRDWISADRVYRKEWVFKDIEDIKMLLEGKYEPDKYRRFIKANYKFDRQYKSMTELL